MAAPPLHNKRSAGRVVALVQSGRLRYIPCHAIAGLRSKGIGPDAGTPAARGWAG
jgi:hypothetical protein